MVEGFEMGEPLLSNMLCIIIQRFKYVGTEEFSSVRTWAGKASLRDAPEATC